ncbi:MAG: hypothetical protein SFV19_19615 [Rhodospirillaceae bacterium]|nr:hypothetical protein [Rhodospirillaceae bacterium]
MPMRKSFGQEPGKKPKKKSNGLAKASPSQSSARNAGAFRARPPAAARPPSRGGR